MLTTALVTVILVQLTLPLVLGAPILIRGDFGEKVASRRRRKGKEPSADAGEEPRPLVPLHCPSCEAPVPLESASFPCPYCGASIRPPAEYVATLELRERTRAELRRAESRWRWSRWVSAWPVVWLLRLLFIAWLLAVLLAHVMLEWPHMVTFLAVILAILEALVGWFFAGADAKARRAFPPRPRFVRVPAASASCLRCGAPVQFVEDSFASVCGYCGGDNYREALAKAARDDARSSEDRAHRSLLDATRALDDVKNDTQAFIAMMVIAELLYAGLFGLVAVLDWLGLS